MTTAIDAPAHPVSVPKNAQAAQWYEELRFYSFNRRPDWTRPVAETLGLLGFGATLTAAEWASLPWYGPIEPWLRSATVSDVLINGPLDDVYVVDGGVESASGVRLSAEWITWLQRQLALRAGLVRPDDATIDDWREPDGSPTHMLNGTADVLIRFALTRPPATPSGPSLALRLLPERWRTLDDLVSQAVLPRETANVLVEAMHKGATLLIAGSTGSGKTTLAAALLQIMGATRRVVMIEDTRELPGTLPNCLNVEVMRSGRSFSACVRNALRQKPNLIVVGEARGPEALAMLEAAATGHPGLTTIHAPNVLAALQNLERMAAMHGDASPELVRAMLTSGVIALVVLHIGRYGGKRRVGAVAQVRRGMGGGSGYALEELFTFDERTDRLVARMPLKL